MVEKVPRLFIIPTPIYDGGEKDIADVVLKEISPIRYFCVENLKTARRHLRILQYKAQFDTEVQFFEWDKHSDSQDFSEIKKWMLDKQDIGLMSEAGMPCIADPGSEIVLLAHQNKYKIEPLVGPSSILLALISSGMNGQNFAFNGYLPIEKSERAQKLKNLAQKVKSEGQTQLFMETPYRNHSIIEDILIHCDASLRLCIAANLSSPDSLIINKLIKDLAKTPLPNFHKIPSIFVLGR